MNKFLFLIFLLIWNIVLRFTGVQSLPPGVLPVVCYLLPFIIWVTLRHESPGFLNDEPGGVNVILIIFLSIAIQPILMLLIAVVGIAAPHEVPAAFRPSGAAAFPAALFSFAIIPAFCEGTVIRGYLLNIFQPQKKIQTVIINGLLSALIHLYFFGAPYAFVTGIFFAFITVWTRSLSAGILAQLSVYAFHVIAGRFSGIFINQGRIPLSVLNEIIKIPDFTARQNRVITNLVIISLIFLPVAIILMRTFLTHNRQNNFKKDMQGKNK